MRRLFPSFLVPLSFLVVPFIYGATAASNRRMAGVTLAAFYDGAAASDSDTKFLSQVDAAGAILQAYDIGYTKVDCAVEQALCERYRPGPLPSLRVYQYGIPNTYLGASMEASDIVFYMRRRYTDHIPEVTASDLQAFQETDKFVVVAFLAAATDASAAFKRVAKKHRQEMVFGTSTDPEAAAAAGVNIPSIVVYRTFDEPRSLVYPSTVADLSADLLEAWLIDLTLPLLGEFNEYNAQEYFNYFTAVDWAKPMANIILDPTDPRAEPLLASIRPVAEKYRSAMVFSWSDARTIRANMYPAYGLPEPTWPSLFIENLKTHRFYGHDRSESIDAASVEEYVQQYLDGLLEPSPKTRPIPEDQTSDVYELVGAEFESVGFDDAKDVFIAFYGDHEREESFVFWPTLYQFGERYATVKDKLTIARMDADGNDVPSSVGEISRYPALKFKPAGTREFIDYNGDLSFESLVAFLEANAANNLGHLDLVGSMEEQVPLDSDA